MTTVQPSPSAYATVPDTTRNAPALSTARKSSSRIA
jgi:hypothetical protein